MGVRVGVAGVGGGGGARGGGDSRPTPRVVGVMIDSIDAIHQPNRERGERRGVIMVCHRGFTCVL